MGPLPVPSSAILTGPAQQSLMVTQWHMLDSCSKFVAKKTKTSRDTIRIVDFIWHFPLLFQTSQSERGLAILDIVISQNITVDPIPDPSSNPPPQFWSYLALKLEDDGTWAYHDNLLKTITFYYVPRGRRMGNWLNLPSSSHQAGVEFKTI